MDMKTDLHTHIKTLKNTYIDEGVEVETNENMNMNID